MVGEVVVKLREFKEAGLSCRMSFSSEYDDQSLGAGAVDVRVVRRVLSRAL